MHKSWNTVNFTVAPYRNVYGVWHEIFDFRFFSRIRFPLAPENPAGDISIFYENSWRYSKLFVYCQCRWHHCSGFSSIPWFWRLIYRRILATKLASLLHTLEWVLSKKIILRVYTATWQHLNKIWKNFLS